MADEECRGNQKWRQHQESASATDEWESSSFSSSTTKRSFEQRTAASAENSEKTSFLWKSYRDDDKQGRRQHDDGGSSDDTLVDKSGRFESDDDTNDRIIGSVSEKNGDSPAGKHHYDKHYENLSRRDSIKEIRDKFQHMMGTHFVLCI